MTPVTPLQQPNRDLIAQLERLLEHARSGELRSMIYIAAWDKNATSHGWTVDPNQTAVLLLGEAAIAQAEVLLNIQLRRDDSIVQELSS